MLDPVDALSDLLVAASRTGDLRDAAAAVCARAEALAAETNWHARAAQTFRDAVRSWSADLAEVREQLDTLAEEAGSAAARARMELGVLGVPR